MFKLFRNKKVLRIVVGFVAITFIGGFVGAAAIQSWGGDKDEELQLDQVSAELDATIDQLKEDLVTYQSLYEEEPDNVDHLVIIGNIHYELARARSYIESDVSQELVAASEAYQQALAMDEERSNLLLSVAMVETSLANYELAETYYRDFITLYPDNFESQALFAQMLAVSSQNDLAKERLAIAESLASTDEEMAIVEQLSTLIQVP